MTKPTGNEEGPHVVKESPYSAIRSTPEEDAGSFEPMEPIHERPPSAVDTLANTSSMPALERGVLHPEDVDTEVEEDSTRLALVGVAILLAMLVVFLGYTAFQLYHRANDPLFQPGEDASEQIEGVEVRPGVGQPPE